MKVTIITAVYNSEATIATALKSVDEQSYLNIEHIIVDGCSTDQTLQVVGQFNGKHRIVISEPDNGIYDALNKGINAASGDIIGFLHSDDFFAYPQAIADLVEAIKLNNTQAVYADLEYVSKENTGKVVRYWRSGSYNSTRLKSGWMPPHPTFFMQRTLYQQLGGFNLKFKIAADYDSMLRYLWKNRVSAAYLPKVVTKMRTGGASNRSIKNIIQKSAEDIQVMKDNKLFWPRVLLLKNFSKIPQLFKK